MNRIQILAFVLVALLAIEIGFRMMYPFDLYIWSESAFLTNLLKMNAGVPIFTAPADANSHVYSPGLEYLVYGVLRPLRRETDIRAARAIVIMLGVAACLCAAWLLTQIARTGTSERIGRDVFGLTAAILLLRLFRSITADTVHPDNLYIFHAVITLLLCYLAISKSRFDLALVGIVWAGFGILVRQTAALTCVGAGVALIISHRWTRRQSLMLVGVAVVSFTVAASFVLLPEYSRFYNVELLLQQRMDLSNLRTLVVLTGFAPYRIVLLLLAVPACLHLTHSGNSEARAFVLVWLCVGLAEVAPAALALLKARASDNHLTIIDMWLFFIVWLAFVRLPSDSTPQKKKEPFFASKWSSVVLAICLLSLSPVKLPPPPSLYAYGRQQQTLISQDLAAGKRVLLAHGAAALIRAGSNAIPLDRAVSFTELYAGGMAGSAGTAERFRQKFYDRVYLNVNWYDLDTQRALVENYRIVARISAPHTPVRLRFLLGYQTALFGEVLILDRLE